MIKFDMSRFGLKRWEAGLVIFFVLIFLTSMILYITGKSVRQYIFPLKGEESVEKVGQLGNSTGSVRREALGEIEFSPAAAGASLYNQDTIVTGPGSHATVTLDDGSTIDLDANAMIRLSFESKSALGGVSRTAKIDVVSGKVTAQAKTRKIVLKSQDTETEIVNNAPPKAIVVKKPVIAPPKVAAPKFERVLPAATSTLPPPEKPIVAAVPLPSPSPSPSPSPLPPAAVVTAIEVLLPKEKAALHVRNGSLNPEVNVDFSWKLKPLTITATPIHLRLKKSGTDATKPVFDEDITSAKVGSKSITLLEPGAYEWELSAPGASRLTKSGHFTVDPLFKSIQLLPPLVGGVKAQNNQWTGKKLKDFSITLHWTEFLGADKYRIWFGSKANSQTALMEKESEKSEINFSKESVFNGVVYYRVYAKLVSGFVVQSDTQAFNFNYLPPIITLPVNGDTLSLKTLVPGHDGYLFTWQKTNFTEGYQIQISPDAGFTNVLIQRQNVDNFYVLKAIKPGVYYWRVKSYNKTLSSPWSNANKFTVTP